MTSTDASLSLSIAEHLTPEEREQLLETVEALKTLIQGNPDDSQSLEILKDAYWRLGMQEEGVAATRQLADTYMRLGQYSSALLEYEGILWQDPNSAEVQAILAELETRLHQGKSSAASKVAISLDFGVEEAPSSPAAVEPALIATEETRMPEIDRKPFQHSSLDNDGNDPLARFLVQHRLASQEAVDSALQSVRSRNAALRADPVTPALAAGLLDELIRAGVEAEPLLAAILDRTKFAYAPLEYYDIDRQIVKTLPEHLTLGRRIVPFDLVSRTLMVAIDNPFDIPAKTLVQQTVDHPVQWHLALPSVLQHILRESYRLGN